MRRRNAYIPVTPSGTYSLYEMRRFLSLKEVREHIASRPLGNFRLRNRGHKLYRLIDWRK